MLGLSDRLEVVVLRLVSVDVCVGGVSHSCMSNGFITIGFRLWGGRFPNDNDKGSLRGCVYR